MQLTQEHFDEAIKKLAPLDVLKEVNKKLTSIEQTLNVHTNFLDSITKNTELWKTEAAAPRSAIQRHEEWFAKIAEKLGLKFEA